MCMSKFTTYFFLWALLNSSENGPEAVEFKDIHEKRDLVFSLSESYKGNELDELETEEEIEAEIYD